MRSYWKHIFLFVVLYPFLAVQAGTLKKISIDKTNNYAFELNNLIDSSDISRRQKSNELFDYVSQMTTLNPNDDPGVIFQALEWVNAQWKHDGWNEATSGTAAIDILKRVHEKGEQFRCVEYGIVLADLLEALGFHARTVSLKSVDVAYGGWGQGHVATEVWSNTIGKWIFIDPQYAISANHSGVPLSFYELYQLKKNGKWDDVTFNIHQANQSKNKSDFQKIVLEYKAFISAYFGYINMPDPRSVNSLTLLLDGKTPVLTFQGMPWANQVFTKDVARAYPELNRTLIRIGFSASNRPDFPAINSQYQIKTNDDYLREMAHFAPKPNLVLQFTNNASDFDHYEIQVGIGAPWTKIEGNSYKLKLSDGKTRFSARTVSKMGVNGMVTYVDFSYE